MRESPRHTSMFWRSKAGCEQLQPPAPPDTCAAARIPLQNTLAPLVRGAVHSLALAITSAHAHKEKTPPRPLASKPDLRIDIYSQQAGRCSSDTLSDERVYAILGTGEFKLPFLLLEDQ